MRARTLPVAILGIGDAPMGGNAHFGSRIMTAVSDHLDKIARMTGMAFAAATIILAANQTNSSSRPDYHPDADAPTRVLMANGHPWLPIEEPVVVRHQPMAGMHPSTALGYLHVLAEQARPGLRTTARYIVELLEQGEVGQRHAATLDRLIETDAHVRMLAGGSALPVERTDWGRDAIIALTAMVRTLAPYPPTGRMDALRAMVDFQIAENQLLLLTGQPSNAELVIEPILREFLRDMRTGKLPALDSLAGMNEQALIALFSGWTEENRQKLNMDIQNQRNAHIMAVSILNRSGMNGLDRRDVADMLRNHVDSIRMIGRSDVLSGLGMAMRQAPDNDEGGGLRHSSVSSQDHFIHKDALRP